MALTEEQLNRMEQIAGLELNSEATNTTSLSDEDFAKMTEIGKSIGFDFNTQQEPDIKTQIINEDPEQAKLWQDKGEITPFEAAKNEAQAFNGTYDKVIQRPKVQYRDPKELNDFGKAVSEFVDDKLPLVKKVIKKLDKILPEFDAEAAIKTAENQAALNKRSQGVNENDKTKRYEIASFSRTGTPIYREINLLDKIGFMEAMREDMIKGTAVGALLEGADDKKIREIKNKIINNEEIYQDELDFLNNKINAEKEKMVRGYSTAGKLGSAVGISLGFGADIIAGSYLAKALGVGALAGTIGTKTYQAARGANIGKNAARAGANIAAWGVDSGLSAGVTTALNSPYRLFATYQDRMLNNEMALTDSGITIFSQSEEKPATAFFKSLGKLYISYFTEMGGGTAISAVGKAGGQALNRYALTPITAKLFEKYPRLEKLINASTTAFAKKYEELNKLPIVGKSTGWIKDNAHFDGFLEECGEEALEDVLNLVAGTDNEERSLENFAKAIFKTPEEWGIIAGSILIQGAGLSAADFVLGNSMAKRKMDPEQIYEVLQGTSQGQKSQIIDELIKSGDIQLSINPNIVSQTEKDKSEIKANFLEQAKNANVDVDVANDVATIFTDILYNTAETQKDLDNIKNAVGKISIQTLTDNEAIEQFNMDNQEALQGRVEKNAVHNQAVQYAGAKKNEFEKAKKEWESKGTESKYFKKFSNNAPVVLNNDIEAYNFKSGESVVVDVFHGTQTQKLKENKFSSKNNEYFFTNKRDSAENYGDNIYECYVKMDNPFVVDLNNENDSQIFDYIDEAKSKGYDGLIALNTYDGASTHNQFVVFNNTQIKSVDNRGTFDETDPNIFFQTGNKQIDNSETYNNLPQDLKDAIDFIYNGEPVYNVTGNEFPNNGESLNERVYQYYKDNFNNSVSIDNIGKVLLDKRSIKDSAYHGLSNNKVNAFAAVPYVLQQGKFLDVTKENGKGEKRYLFAAPITINKNNKKEEYFCEVVVKSNKDRQGFYIHEVELKKKLADVFSTAQHGTSASSKSIIADLINKYNPNIKNNEQTNSIKPNFQEMDYNEQTTEEGIKNARGFTYQTENFDGTIRENIIVLMNGRADKSTLLHECGHIYLNVLNVLAKDNEKARDMLLKVNKLLRYDGKQYTEAQHEKFARTFEAYVKTGKAPTYGLKRVFEHFRKWLGDIYNTVAMSGKINISKEWKDIFDELLGDKSVDVQKDISNSIIEKAKNFASIKIVNENNQKVKQNVLTQNQVNYRNTAYNIIWTAISNSRKDEVKNFIKDKRQLYTLLGNINNKKNAKQREKLEFILRNLDDEISSNGGFLQEWAEFFNDPGLEDGGMDAEFAMDAFDVIVNKKYLVNENNFEEITEEEVQRAQYELDYIIDNYKNDKDNTMVAFFDWIDTQHPYIQEDLIKQWETKTNEIDRYDALDKWQQAKEDLKLNAAKLKGQGNYAGQFAQYVRSIVKRLDFMQDSDKAKLFGKLKDFNLFQELEENLDDIMDFAQTLYSASQRRHLADDIQREVRQTIHEWQNGIKKTKYTYPANKLFERLRAINNMNPEEIEQLYDAQANDEAEINYVSDDVNDADYYSSIEKMFIKFKYNGSYYNSTEFLVNLLTNIQNAKFTAKLARDEIDFERRMQQINLIDECARALDIRKSEIEKKESIKKWGVFNALGANLNGFLKMLFNDNIKNKFSLDYLYAKKDAQVGADRREFLEKAKNIFGFKGKFSDIQLFNMFIDMNKASEFEIKRRYTPDKVNGTYRITHTDKETGKTFTDKILKIRQTLSSSEWDPEPVKLSRMQVLYYYIQAKNPISYKMLTDMGDETTPPKGQFDKFEFDNMIAQLTPKEQLLGDLMQLTAEKYWEKLNEYHIKKYQTELGKVKNYFPRRSETSEVDMRDMFNDFVQFSATGTFQKQRTANAGVRIEAANALAVLFDHIERANTVSIMGEQLDLMNRVLKDKDLLNKIQNVWGQKVKDEFLNQVTGNLFTGQSLQISLYENFYSQVVNNAIKSNIFLKPQIGLKQMISFMNYGKGDEYVSAKEWMQAFAKQAFSPSQWKKNINYMLNIPYLKDRFSRGGSTDALKKELEARVISKLNLLDNLWSLPVRLGDIGAIILGGKPYIDVLIQKGYSESEAQKIFIETTVNDQQSSIPSTLSNMQRNASKSPLAKMMFAYQNTPWQYYRQCTNAIGGVIQEPTKQNIVKAGKMLFLYGWLFPAIFSMASSLSPIILASSGDDEDFFSDINPFNTFTTLATQHPIFGETLKAILDAAEGKYTTSSDLFSVYTRALTKLIKDIKKDEITLEDIWDASAVFGELNLGIPMRSIGNSLSGIYDVTQGDVLKGLFKTMGYSNYRAEKASGQ